MDGHAGAPRESVMDTPPWEAAPLTPPPREEATPTVESSAKIGQRKKTSPEAVSPEEKAGGQRKALSPKGGVLAKAKAKPKARAAKARGASLAPPKAPKSAYMIWSAENRECIVKEQGVSGFAATTRAVAAAWAGVSAEERAPFVQRQRELSAQYAEEAKKDASMVKGKGSKMAGKKGKKKKANTDERGFEVVWDKHGERKYRGVSYKEEGRGGWQAAMYWKGKTVCIGRYATPEVAAAAYKATRQALAKRAPPEEAKKAGQAAAADAAFAEDVAAPAQAPTPAPSTTLSQDRAPEPEPSKKRRPFKLPGGGPPAKRSAAAVSAEAAAYTIDAATMGLAERLGLAGALKNLAQRPQVQVFSPQDMLESLQACGGLVNPAKERLLQGRAPAAVA